MKTFLKYVAALAIVGAFFVACSDWTDPEREITQHPDQQSPILRDNAYYQALREYKKTKHKIAFGWYGSWTAVGASYQTRLQSAPDSMDIISIWSQWHSLTPEQIADKEFVQKIKGTKVTFTIFSDKMPEPFLTEIGGGEYTDEAIEAYAKAYCKDSMDKYSYDGIDVDYEPGYGASGPFVGHDNELFRKLILAMSKYVGPKSGTGRLLMIDGVPYAVHADVADCFDYGIVQAYNSYGYTDLQDRFDDAYKKGWKPEQYIFAENFESLWKTGGVSHECRDGQWVNSLLGMARFNPTQGFGAGFGAYHMEYEYANSSMPYKYMRGDPGCEPRRRRPDRRSDLDRLVQIPVPGRGRRYHHGRGGRKNPGRAGSSCPGRRFVPAGYRQFAGRCLQRKARHLLRADRPRACFTRHARRGSRCVLPGSRRVTT